MRRIILFTFLYIALCFTIQGQTTEVLPTTKEVIVETKDSTIRAHVLLKKESIKIEDFEIFYYWHYKGMIGSNMGGYTGELLHGEYLVLDKQKRLLTKGSFETGRKEGVWKKWKADGSLKRIENYREGRLHGKVIVYSHDGNVLNITQYKEGVLLEKQDKERKNLFERKANFFSDSLNIDKEPLKEAE